MDRVAVVTSLLSLLLLACGSGSPSDPQGGANVVFLGWDCCGSACVESLACVGFPASFGSIGRIRNIGDQTAYAVRVTTRPCSTSFDAAGLRLPTLRPGEEREFCGIRSEPPGCCPILDPILWSDTPVDSMFPGESLDVRPQANTPLQPTGFAGG